MRINLRRVVATRESAAALLSNLVLTLKEVKETHGKRFINEDGIKIVIMLDKSVNDTFLHA